MGNLGGGEIGQQEVCELEERKPEAAPKLGGQPNNPDSNQRGNIQKASK